MAEVSGVTVGYLFWEDFRAVVLFVELCLGIGRGWRFEFFGKSFRPELWL